MSIGANQQGRDGGLGASADTSRNQGLRLLYVSSPGPPLLHPRWESQNQSLAYTGLVSQPTP